jgi:deoxycytidine triphosphate deaminase
MKIMLDGNVPTGRIITLNGLKRMPDMSLLSYNKLCDLVSKNVITNVKKDQINSSSIDITLGGKILVEKLKDSSFDRNVISLKRRDPLEMFEHDLNAEPFQMYPNQFILAQSEQIFNLPNNISAEYKLKSSMARIGLEHMNAGWCDAGWNGSVLTLEFKNMTQNHFIELEAGVAIGQVVFFEHEPVPHDRSYAVRGRYNGDTSVSGIKAVTEHEWTEYRGTPESEPKPERKIEVRGPVHMSGVYHSAE